MRRLLTAAVLLLAAPAAARTAAAQAAADSAGRPAAPARPFVRQTLAGNPLLLTQHLVSGEYERAVGTRGAAVGIDVLADWRGDLNNDFGPAGSGVTSSQVKLKYYPRHDGLRGFAVGATAGVMKLSRLTTVPAQDAAGTPTLVSTRHPEVAPSAGVVLDYNAFFGRRRRLFVGLGVGERGASVRDRPGAGRRFLLQIPDGRLQLGVGF